MQTTKRRLRVVGLLLLVVAIPASMLVPAFGPSRHTGGMSAEERRELAQWDVKYALGAGMVIGTILTLIITSFAIRPPREP